MAIACMMKVARTNTKEPIVDEIEIAKKLQAMIHRAIVEHLEGITNDDESFIDNDELTSNQDDTPPTGGS